MYTLHEHVPIFINIRLQSASKLLYVIIISNPVFNQITLRYMCMYFFRQFQNAVILAILVNRYNKVDDDEAKRVLQMLQGDVSRKSPSIWC